MEPRVSGGTATSSRPLRDGGLLLAVFVAAAATMFLATVVLLWVWAAFDPDVRVDGRLPTSLLLVGLVVPPVSAALVALAGTGWARVGPRLARVRRELALRWRGRDLLIGLGIGVAGLLLTLPAAVLWSAWVGAEEASSALGEAFSGRELHPVAGGLMFLAIWLVVPASEEVLFRGVLWRALEHLRWNRWLIFAVTTVVFSFAHLELLRTPLLLVVSLPVGLARLVTGNLLAAVVAHQVNNFLPALTLLLVTTGVLSV